MFKKIAVLGAGTMGQGIAQFFARNQLLVTSYDTDKKILFYAQTRLVEHEGFKKYLSFTSDLKEAISDADLIIETVTEDLDIKRRLYKDMAVFLKKDAIVSSNTSSYPLAVLALNQPFANRMIFTHFFNPAELIPLVELVHSKDTLPGMIENVSAFLRHFGKVPVVLKKDSKGFIANRLQAAILREACFLVESGVGDVNDIDTVMTEGLGLRWALSGPFKIVDIGGLDVWDKVCMNLLPDLNDKINTPEIIKEKVRQGKIGLKTWQGFYKYDMNNNDAENSEQKLIELLKLKEVMTRNLP